MGSGTPIEKYQSFDRPHYMVHIDVNPGTFDF
jgi:hypothetical protein